MHKRGGERREAIELEKHAGSPRHSREAAQDGHQEPSGQS